MNVPVWAIWVIPYACICGWWAVAYLWAAWRMEGRLYEAFFISSAVMQVSALTIFTLFATYVMRPMVPAVGWSSQLLNWIYAHDYAYNAFPSGHVYITIPWTKHYSFLCEYRTIVLITT